ncbi:MAG: hypothetical protein RMY62_018960 [Nostoc sp. ZfuVER08]|jgi:hypothetical protein|uniref:Iron-containing redox enzyme family protein n=1 Tax=Nostoc punctiforme FACHB-252 TaxID=1357509 RepID=A0ABR8HCT8_NOSPU|nr:hypothetical protein [Nostoc punctiforme]MBD2613464.1 hypothetical protein [Nostoc punctiforme FACHB-252]MBL1198729.1 hypothetical protein [Nostoc sp. GBBB01]MDZ8013977.1 hypothetical protein [Nostoc sp. ZfuVER08]
MKSILELIEKKNQEYAQLPFFKYMEDETINPRQKLAFAPVIAPLAMEFSELCKRILRDEPTTDYIQQMVNVHTHEEHFHWQWLLEDMEKMGIDYPMRFSDAVRFLWSEHTLVSRSMLPLFERYTRGAHPIIKLVAIEVSEVTANVFFRSTKYAALQLQETTQAEFRYFGMRHNHIENTHTLHTPASLQTMRDIEVPEEIRQQILEFIDVAFEYFTDLINEFFAYITTHSYQEPFARVYQSERSLRPV